ncbi:LOW QUALITY PROTEIN: ly6/PLAUR domain-containing protein 6-like [Spinachia spinachia]
MMEAWPTVAWVLLVTNVADWLKTVQSRDFSLTDIILLHPSTTPHPGGFKCFTCEDAADNYECNRWAPDVYCPKDARYCSVRHVMDNHGDSVSVTKRCVALKDCLSTGCADVSDDGYQVRGGRFTSWEECCTSPEGFGLIRQMCSSCCQGNICNVLVPRNASTSVFSSKSPLSSSSRGFLPAAQNFFTVTIVIMGFFTTGSF